MDYEFILPSGVTVTVSEREVDEIITTGLSNRFYWRFCGFVDAVDVFEFLDRKLRDKKKLEKIAYYVLFFAENVVFSVYVNIKGNVDEAEAYRYKLSMMPVLKKLREHYNRVKRTEDVDEIYNIINKMISLCLNHGMDPF